MNLTQLDKTIFTKNLQLKFLITRKKKKFPQSEDRQFSDNFRLVLVLYNQLHITE